MLLLESQGLSECIVSGIPPIADFFFKISFAVATALPIYLYHLFLYPRVPDMFTNSMQ